jgi:hypothetical protein
MRAPCAGGRNPNEVWRAPRDMSAIPPSLSVAGETQPGESLARPLRRPDNPAKHPVREIELAFDSLQALSVGSRAGGAGYGGGCLAGCARRTDLKRSPRQASRSDRHPPGAAPGYPVLRGCYLMGVQVDIRPGAAPPPTSAPGVLYQLAQSLG